MQLVLLNQNWCHLLSKWIQYLVKIPIFRLEQSILDLISVQIQQVPTTILHVNINVATKQLVYGNGVSFHQPIKVNPHSQPSGKLSRDSLGGWSHDWDPLTQKTTTWSTCWTLQMVGIRSKYVHATMVPTNYSSI